MQSPKFSHRNKASLPEVIIGIRLQRKEETADDVLQLDRSDCGIRSAQDLSEVIIHTASSNAASNNEIQSGEDKFHFYRANFADLQTEVLADDVLHFHGVKDDVDHQQDLFQQKVVESEEIAEPQTVTGLLDQIEGLIHNAPQRTARLLPARPEPVHQVVL